MKFYRKEGIGNRCNRYDRKYRKLDVIELDVIVRYNKLKKMGRVISNSAPSFY